MDSNEKYEHAKFILERFDHYNESVNNKGTFYIGLNTFIIGGLIAGFITIYSQLDKPAFLWCLITGVCFCSVLSSIFIIIAINPFLSSGNKDSKKRSLIFFGSVAEYQKDNFVDTFMEQDQESKIRDMVSQVWMVASGLTKKYKMLKLSGWLLIAQFILLLPTIYSIAKTLLQ